MRMVTAPLDHLGHAIAAKLPYRRIGSKPARTPRPLRIPVDRIASFAVMRNVSRVMRHGSAMSRRVRDEGIAAVIRHIEPLVPIRRPRISQLASIHQPR